MKTYSLLILIGMVAICSLVLLGCATSASKPSPAGPQPEPEFTLIRPGRQISESISELPQYRRAGDPDGVWIKALDGATFLRLGK